ncbi:MAG: SIS domain-containing protein [Herbinix sp.]|nr:SIS domain-containing protein [Herbinix sp.]
MREKIIKLITESIYVKQIILESKLLLSIEEKLAEEIVHCISNGGKLVICGNGGSASDALHFASEMIGKFQKERKPWPVIVLNADVATLTSIANDYGYDEAFARQLEGHLTKKDIFIGISTSGNSENVYRAVLKAKEIGAKAAALLGMNGGKIGRVVDYPLIVPYKVTARVQESHILLIHILCELVEDNLSETKKVIES